MSDLQTLIKIAWATARAHNLPEHIICGMCDHESDGWDPWAMRYEPGFYVKYIAPLIDADKINVTEAHARATSFGLMQVMGETARELGFEGKWLTELCDPIVGIEYGCRKLSHEMERTKGNLNDALLAYNGGGNKQYPAIILAKAAPYARG